MVTQSGLCDTPTEVAVLVSLIFQAPLFSPPTMLVNTAFPSLSVNCPKGTGEPDPVRATTALDCARTEPSPRQTPAIDVAARAWRRLWCIIIRKDLKT